MVRGNKLIGLKAAQLSELVPEFYKSRYWIESEDEIGGSTFTALTWQELTENAEYRRLNGKSPRKTIYTYIQMDVTQADETALELIGISKITNIT